MIPVGRDGVFPDNDVLERCVISGIHLGEALRLAGHTVVGDQGIGNPVAHLDRIRMIAIAPGTIAVPAGHFEGHLSVGFDASRRIWFGIAEIVVRDLHALDLGRDDPIHPQAVEAVLGHGNVFRPVEHDAAVGIGYQGAFDRYRFAVQDLHGIAGRAVAPQAIGRGQNAALPMDVLAQDDEATHQRLAGVDRDGGFVFLADGDRVTATMKGNGVAAAGICQHGGNRRTSRGYKHRCLQI